MEQKKYSTKEILQAYRPSGEDAGDAFFADALKAVENDPDLKKWFDEQQSFDSKMTAALQNESAPADLKAKILSIDLDDTEFDSSTSLKQRRGLFDFGGHRQPASLALLGLAACFVLLLGVTVIRSLANLSYLPSSQLIAQKVLEMNETGKISLGKITQNDQERRQWLAKNDSPHTFSIPDKLSSLTALGCQTYDMNGAQVSLICFKLSDEQTIHLFVVHQDALRDPPGDAPTISSRGSTSVAAWTSGKHSFFMTASNIDKSTFKKLI